MSLIFSTVVPAEHASHGTVFSARRILPAAFGGAADPVMGFDHYRMNAVTFAPHPHAGFSAISYLFEESEGGLRNRDSLGHDFVIEPGGIVWTQAGAGAVHDELPATPGKQVHGLQIFVNLSAQHKMSAPEVFRLSAADVPVWQSEAGSQMRLPVGRYGGLVSPLEPREPFNLFDLALVPGDEIALPVSSGWDVLIYVERGDVDLASEAGSATLREAEAVAVMAEEDGGTLRLRSDADARVVILSGPAQREPVVQYGPFIMTTEAEIHAAMTRYRRGDMGQLAPLA